MVSQHAPVAGQAREVEGGAAGGAGPEGVCEVDAEEARASAVARLPLEAVLQGPVGEGPHVHRVQAHGCTVRLYIDTDTEYFIISILRK